MEYFVYILFSNSSKRYYCGQTDNHSARLLRRNEGKVTSTKHGIPWIMVGLVKVNSRSEAMLLEKKIKKRGIDRWVNDNKNIIMYLHGVSR